MYQTIVPELEHNLREFFKTYGKRCGKIVSDIDGPISKVSRYGYMIPTPDAEIITAMNEVAPWFEIILSTGSSAARHLPYKGVMNAYEENCTGNLITRRFQPVIARKGITQLQFTHLWASFSTEHFDQQSGFVEYSYNIHQAEIVKRAYWGITTQIIIPGKARFGKISLDAKPTAGLYCEVARLRPAHRFEALKAMEEVMKSAVGNAEDMHVKLLPHHGQHPSCDLLTDLMIHQGKRPSVEQSGRDAGFMIVVEDSYREGVRMHTTARDLVGRENSYFIYVNMDLKEPFGFQEQIQGFAERHEIQVAGRSQLAVHYRELKHLAEQVGKGK